VDVLASVSRLFTAITSKEHQKIAGRIRNLMSKYQEVELLVRIGEYKKGSDAAADEAIAKIDAINEFLKQGMHDKSSFDQTLQAMDQLTR
jgi:type III secretion protein N (ATPase)